MPERLSRGREEVTELVHIAPIRRGLVQRGELPSPGICYADRLRTILEAFHRREDEGFPSVNRIFRGIHSAQWALLDGDSRLMLSVVFDGTFNDYMRALAREVPGMLGLIWSNCEGWKPVQGDPDQMIQFIRRYQVKVAFLYVHHPQLTVPDIDRLIHANVPAPASAEERLEKALQEYEARVVRTDTLKDPVFDSYQKFQLLIGSLYTKEELDLASNEAYGGRAARLRAKATATPPPTAPGMPGAVAAASQIPAATRETVGPFEWSNPGPEREMRS